MSEQPTKGQWVIRIEDQPEHPSAVVVVDDDTEALRTYLELAGESDRVTIHHVEEVFVTPQQLWTRVEGPRNARRTGRSTGS